MEKDLDATIHDFAQKRSERKDEYFEVLKIAQVVAITLLCGLLWWQCDKNRIQCQVSLQLILTHLE